MKVIKTSLAVTGGGASGVCAAVQAARLGVQVVIAEPSPWLGGMLTAAGVSAVDGNYHLQGGLWGEFRRALEKHYGGDDALKTGWVSNTLFDPRVGEKILSSWVDEAGVRVLRNHRPVEVEIRDRRIGAVILENSYGEQTELRADVFIEATETGELIRLAKLPHFFGLEGREETGESLGPVHPVSSAQDITCVLTVKKGPCSEPEPHGYDPEEFRELLGNLTPQKVLEYGLLPGGSYMLNWPRGGNDYFLSSEAYYDPAKRPALFEEAKNVSRRLLHHLNTAFDLPPLAIDRDIYPTEDGFPPIPYYREALRIRGRERIRMEDLEDPFGDPDRPLYKQAVAVGDYPLDHHRLKNPDPMDLPFPSIPSFSIPFGSLISRDCENLLAAEKSISVTSLANGSTRLQPVVMGIGQAAGAAAYLALGNNQNPGEISLKKLQRLLLKQGAYILPYRDLLPGTILFEAAQIAGTTGLMRGEGVPKDWANETWFHPDKPIDGTTWKQAFGEELQEKVTLSLLIDRLCRIYNREEYLHKAPCTAEEGIKKIKSMVDPSIPGMDEAIKSLGEEICLQPPRRGAMALLIRILEDAE